jgi:small-conductance mechanosensitive channel
LWFIYAAYLGLTAASLASGDGKVPKVLSIITYACSGGLALTAFKNHYIEALFLKRSSASVTASDRVRQANAFLLRRGTSIVLSAKLGLACVDAISLNFCVAAGSLLGFAGVGGLALGLATKDLVSNLVGGCLIFLTRPFGEGVTISFGNIPESKVLRIGYYQTTVRGKDEQVRTVPNALLISNTISNLSRRSHRTLTQSVYLTYGSLSVAGAVVERLQKDLSKLPGVNLTTRNLRVTLKALTATAIEVEVELHFRGGDGNVFGERRTAALLAIGEAVRDCGAEFAVLNGLLETPPSK